MIRTPFVAAALLLAGALLSTPAHADTNLGYWPTKCVVQTTGWTPPAATLSLTLFARTPDQATQEGESQ